MRQIGGSGPTDLLFYDRSAGDAKFYSIDEFGNLALLKHHTNWPKTLDQIIIGKFGDRTCYTDLLFYENKLELRI